MLRDVIFGDRRYFRALLAGSIERIAPATAALKRASGRTLPILYALGNWGLDWCPGTEELQIRQQIMRDAGPAFIEELMDELRVRHLDAPPKPHGGPNPLERLNAAYAAEQERRA